MTVYVSLDGLAKLKEKFPSADYDPEAKNPALIVPRDELIPVMRYLHDEEGFDRCGNVTAVDWKDSFEMVYHLYSMEENRKLTLKTKLPHDELPDVESATQVYPGVEYEEREVYDLMGINFLHHPEMKRILMPDDYPAHPLRKDFVAPVPSIEKGVLKWTVKQKPSS